MDTKRYCVFDTETGGVGAEAAYNWSIFQLGACIYQTGGDGGCVLPGVEHSFEVVINEPGQLYYQDEAMAVNGFTVERVRSEGIHPAQAMMKFVLWLHKNFPGDEKVTLMGHNVGYDVSFLQRLFRLAECLPMYDSIFNYRAIDTASIARFLIDAGVVPLQKNDSKGLFEHFGVAPAKPHDALSDAIATGKLYEKMLTLLHPTSPHIFQPARRYPPFLPDVIDVIDDPLGHHKTIFKY